MPLQQKLKELQHAKQALLATNFYNFETLDGILKAAFSEGKSVILQLTKGSIEYLGLPVAMKLARAMLKLYGVEGWVHLDHGDSYELVAACLDEGFDSVMIDASEKSFSENVRITRRVVTLAKQYGANVEAELGYIAKLGQKNSELGYTEPTEAKLFVEETGVDALAVAIGSAHGFYKAEPKLDIGRLAEINRETEAVLVLHGASGIPGDLLRQAIQNGICKINLATEIKDTFMQTLRDSLQSNMEIDLRRVFPFATNAVAKLVQNKIRDIELKKS
ncbi:MAG: class II fructose-bisphosphate aldolase [Chitinophagaceae bacterium]|nr:class II fructose-bisphosphate aldolase [Chitinophagaceae bacterium]MCW5928057.1 class II fructose-bisphosphate aldolase [Chitinophagaceae bacterium]